MDEHGPDAPEERHYLPTLAELIDRLSIVQMKAIFIDKAAYAQEIADIKHDINIELKKLFLSAETVHAILLIALTNRVIWENESEARKGGAGQNDRLRMTHSLNGLRNTAKNIIAKSCGERVDLKIDCLAADLPKDFGNWDVFNGT